LLPQEVERPATVVCLVEHPEQVGDVDGTTRLHYSGEVTFALWPDKTYRSELSRIPWLGWDYFNLGSRNPHERVGPYTAAYIEHDFMAMRERYASKPFWNARRPRRGMRSRRTRRCIGRGLAAPLIAKPLGVTSHPLTHANNPEMGYPIMGSKTAAWLNHYTPRNTSTSGHFWLQPARRRASPKLRFPQS